MDISIIGGADGPTSIYIRTSPSAFVWGIVLAAAAAVLLIFLVRKRKQKK